jgi:7-carboxy-7-deazaguanine synthase
MMKGKVSEIFESVQGEGLYFGERQIFIRFFGCNLSCKYCDTKIDYFTEYDPEGLFAKLKLQQNNHHSISFTGGEPLLQGDFLKDILRLSRKSGMRNYLETNGTLPEALEEVIADLDIVAMDLKLPSSTGLDPLWDTHRKFLKIASRSEVFLKSVICHSTIEEDLKEGLQAIKEIDKSAILVLQPNSFENHGQLDQKLKKFQGICEEEGVISCIIPQMHKIWGIK